MPEINDAVFLYTLYADRMQQSGFCPNQAQVYREMAELIKSCATVEESMEKIKNSKYYLAPSVALMQDKLSAQARAATENHMPKLAAVYEKKLEEISNNPSAMHTPGYTVDAQNIKTKYFEILDAFFGIYESYFLMHTCEPTNTELMARERANLQNHFATLAKEGVNFQEFAQVPEFRALILSNNSAYPHFTANAEAIAQNGINYSAAASQIQAEFAQEMEKVNAQQAEITAIGAQNLAHAATARAIAVPPENEHGSYTFIEEEVVLNA